MNINRRESVVSCRVAVAVQFRRRLSLSLDTTSCRKESRQPCKLDVLWRGPFHIV